jgi:hypothetical protein
MNCISEKVEYLLDIGSAMHILRVHHGSHIDLCNNWSTFSTCYKLKKEYFQWQTNPDMEYLK